MRHYLSQRRTTGILLTLTALLLGTSFAIPEVQTSWLLRDYSLTPRTFQWIYGAGLAGLLLAFVGEPSIRHELRTSGALPLMVFVAVAGNAAAAWQLTPDQAARFARPVVALSALLAWGVAVGVGGVLLALETPLAPASARFRRYGWAVGGAVFVGMLAVHIGSTGHFNRLNDVYDEVWAASAMANYVQNGDFSPSLGGSPYGTNDPFFSRWLLWNGMWAAAFGKTDLTTLRAFPTAAGVLLAAIIGLGLWRQPRLSPLARLTGLALLVSLTVFGRTAHNLRMDIGLGIYGALLLFALLVYLHDEARGWRPLLAGGLALYLGLETIPTVAVIVAFYAGLFVVWRAVRRPLHTTRWPHILAYGGGCVVAALGYVMVHFAPNFAESWANFQQARATYVAMGSVAAGSPLSPLGSTHRFSFVLSPAELFAVYAALGALAVVGTRAERGLLVAYGAAQLTIHAVLGGSFGYQMAFVPLAVYAAARVVQRRAGVVLALVLVPILAAAPLQDMVTDWRLQLNQRLIAELDLLTWRVPEGGAVIGDDLFWLTLHDRADFYGHSALQHYRAGYRLPDDAAVVAHIAPDMVVCKPDVPDQARLCALAAAYFGTPPGEFSITNGTYHVYTASGG